MHRSFEFTENLDVSILGGKILQVAQAEELKKGSESVHKKIIPSNIPCRTNMFLK